MVSTEHIESIVLPCSLLSSGNQHRLTSNLLYKQRWSLPPLPSPNLNELLLFQVPLLDAIVSGATEQYVSLDSQAFDTIIVRRLKVVGWANGTRHIVTQLEHLQRRRGRAQTGA